MFWNQDYSRLGGDLSTQGRVAEIYACVKDFIILNFGKPGIAVFYIVLVIRGVPVRSL